MSNTAQKTRSKHLRNLLINRYNNPEGDLDGAEGLSAFNEYEPQQNESDILTDAATQDAEDTIAEAEEADPEPLRKVA